MEPTMNSVFFMIPMLYQTWIRILHDIDGHIQYLL